MRILTLFFLGCCLWSGVGKGEVKTSALALSSLTDPTKLATLKGERAANPCLQKCVYWLAYAEEQGEKPEAVLDESAKLNKTAGTPYAGFVSWGLLENLKIAKELGLLTPEGMAWLGRVDSGVDNLCITI
jgi:hypothetical protein